MKLKQDDIGIGCNLVRLRKSRGLSQAQCVRELQLLGSTISLDVYKKMERDRYNIRIYDLIILKEFYGVDYNEFFLDLSLPKFSYDSNRI